MACQEQKLVTQHFYWKVLLLLLPLSTRKTQRTERRRAKRKQKKRAGQRKHSVLAELVGLALGRVRPPVTSTVRVPDDPSGPWAPNPFFLYSRLPTPMDDSHLVLQSKFVQSAQNNVHQTNINIDLFSCLQRVSLIYILSLLKLRISHKNEDFSTLKNNHFYIFAIVNNAAQNTGMQISEILISTPLDKYSKIRLLDHIVVQFLIF